MRINENGAAMRAIWGIAYSVKLNDLEQSTVMHLASRFAVLSKEGAASEEAGSVGTQI